ncbi:MAG: Maf family nucleotide pyrophosphatase [Zoogloeaceae bacterium]|jgi:septum formation protein|nr:Maf family nucleotide pyrophosphatase [Zoogloeaceae bacterium]
MESDISRCPPLVLASTSPFRRALLARLGLPFQTVNPRTDETPLPGEAPEDLALRLSEAKARAVAGDFPGALVIGSDQVAIADGRIHGKPGNHANAVRQLRALSGKTVNFFTGLCLLDTRDDTIHCVGVPTAVTFRRLTDADIEAYLRREPAYDCAGSARSEGLGIALIARLEGTDPNALVGLPLVALCDLLAACGVNVLLAA